MSDGYIRNNEGPESGTTFGQFSCSSCVSWSSRFSEVEA